MPKSKSIFAPTARSPFDTDPTHASQLPRNVVSPGVAEPLPAADAIAIHELINRIYLAEDSRDAKALEEAVTEDFIQDHSIAGGVVGAKAFASWVLDAPYFFNGRRHMAGNIITSSAGTNEAFAVHYIFVWELFSDAAQASDLPRFLGHGIVRDRLVKDGVRWRVAHRIYDQFGVLPAVFTDADLRKRGSQLLIPSEHDSLD
jgi:SnoaL-like domain